jgi:hypothetical protein
LYFACDDEKKKDEDGFVYCFQDKFLDLTKIIDKIGFGSLLSIFSLSSKTNNKWASEIHESLDQFRRANGSVYNRCHDTLLKRILECSQENKIIVFEKLEEAFPGLYDVRRNEHELTIKEYIEETLNSDFGRISDELTYYSESPVYRELIRIWLDHSWYDEARIRMQDGNLNAEQEQIFPTVIYSPLLSFSRATSQHSRFLYQFGRPNFQPPLSANAEIHIDASAKPSIMRMLDKLGINGSTVYADYDSIANYTRDMSSKSLWWLDKTP